MLLGLVSLAWVLIADARERSAAAVFRLPELRVESVSKGEDGREVVLVARNPDGAPPLEYVSECSIALVGVRTRQGSDWVFQVRGVCGNSIGSAVLEPGAETRASVWIEKSGPFQLSLAVRAIGASDWQDATIELGE
ncbi:MAG: hypothetical protein NTV21_12255 [Planctomycetota bacterium]|nr:hypothetical protein [Planctomycetota bacterium]